MKIKTIDLKQSSKVLGTMFLCAVLAISVVWPTPTRAQTSYSVEQLQVLLNQILAQLNALQGGQTTSGICPYTWTRSLGQGSSGVDVMRLQQYLNTDPDTSLAVSGVGSKGLETQYYGPLTAAAVSKFQTKYRTQVLTPLGLVNPTGYFGPSSMAQANRLCATTNPTPGGDNGNGGPLQGGAGFIDDLELISNISNEEVGEGDKDVEVLGLEVTPSGSDIEIRAVTVNLDPVGHDEDFDDYADELSIWINGREYGRIDADEFDDRNSFRRTITLDRGAIIREDRMGELVIAVSAVSNLDSTQEGDEWRATVESIRFSDATGASITNNDADNLSRTFSFTEFAVARGLEVNVRSGDDEINDSRIIEVSASSNTRDVAVHSFEVEVEGDSDITIEDLRVSVETTGGDLNDIVSAAYLYHDGKRVDSVNINSNSNTITFENIDIDLDAGDVHEFEVRFDFRAANGTNYASGATIDVDVSSADLDAWGMEDERGNDVDQSVRRGSASADAHILQTEGVAMTLVNSTTREVYVSSSPSSSYGEFRMTVDVRAIGGTIYVPTTSTRSSSAENVGVTYQLENNLGEAYISGTSVSTLSRISGGSVQGNYVRINEGQTARFELVATLDPEDFGQYRAQIVSFGWNESADTPDATTVAVPEANYQSGYQVISN